MTGVQTCALPICCHRDILIDYKENKVDSAEVLEFFNYLKEFFVKKLSESILINGQR